MPGQTRSSTPRGRVDSGSCFGEEAEIETPRRTVLDSEPGVVRRRVGRLSVRRPGIPASYRGDSPPVSGFQLSALNRFFPTRELYSARLMSIATAGDAWKPWNAKRFSGPPRWLPSSSGDLTATSTNTAGRAGSEDPRKRPYLMQLQISIESGLTAPGANSRAGTVSRTKEERLEDKGKDQAASAHDPCRRRNGSGSGDCA